MSDDRRCTCPPMERPHPCARKFALSECKAATVMDPICYRWRHQKDEVWKYGHQPQHLVPPRGKELIGYYIVQPLYTADAIESLQAECERLRAELAAAQSTIKLQEGMLDDRDALAEKLDAAEIDAERYRWLTSAPPHSVRWQRVRLEWFSSQGGWNPIVGLDATIDAAMAQENIDE